MGHITYTQGENHMLQSYFHGLAFTGPFYVGLGSGPKPASEDATLADIIEVTGLNYARQPIMRDDSAYGWNIVGDTAFGTEVTFTNLDNLECWEPADYIFLTLSPSAQDADDILIASADMSQTILLDAEQVLRVVFKFRQL